jgi:hypothetical protein
MSDQLLENLPGVLERDAVADFCQAVLSRHSEQWPISEDILAHEFLAFADLRSLPQFEEISQVCVNRLGISVSSEPLPDGMRGYNGSYRNRREILISTNQDYSGAKLHTLLHELREILENELEKLGYPIVKRENSDLEQVAESFPLAVQFDAVRHAFPTFWAIPAAIERRWLRIGAHILLVFGLLFYLLDCSSVKQREDALAQLRT